MNILFTFKYNLWERLPIKASNGKLLFDWCELNNPNTNWRDCISCNIPFKRLPSETWKKTCSNCYHKSK